MTLRARGLAAGAGVVVLIAAAVFAVRWRAGQTHAPAQTQTHTHTRVRESCLDCHAAMRGVGAAHAELGCAACHLGDVRARDAAGAHVGLEPLAGDFATVARTCGQGACHPVETARVRSSLMARAPGILAVDRFAFGERATPHREPADELDRLDPHAAPASPAESHVRKLCAGCHLGVRKPRAGDLGEASRGGGCTACHWAPPAPGEGPLHPEVSAHVPERRCAGCHGRSGRIALSYRGRVELEAADPRVDGHTEDGRPTGPAPADAHARAGLTCVDCHVERELMGSGARELYAHEALEVACQDCHGPARGGPEPRDEDRERVAEALRRSWVRRGRAALSSSPLYTARGTPLVRTDAATRTLWRAEDGRAVALPQVSGAHAGRGHERLACQACHSGWAPRCKSCHTSFVPEASDVDHLSGRPTPGGWREVAGGNDRGPPLLALGPRGRIEPFVEGMTLTVVVGERSVSRALYAPLDPHTTGPARTCASCHVDVEATFPAAGELTRPDARLLTAEERARVARVGACVGCHARGDDAIYADFAASWGRRRATCR